MLSRRSSLTFPVIGRACAARKNRVSAKDLDCSSVLLQKPVIRRAMLFAWSILAGTELLSATTIA